MTFDLKAGATALALILAPLAADAHHKPGHDGGPPDHAQGQQGGHGGGNGNGGGFDGGDDHDDDEDVDEDGPRDRADRACPPGLADRDPACVPPGLARQGVTTEDRIGEPTDLYMVGDILTEDDEPALVGNWDRLGLDPLPEGEVYAIVDDTIVVVDVASWTILEILRRAALPGNQGG